MKKKSKGSIRFSVRLDHAHVEVLKELADQLGWDESKCLRWLVGIFASVVLRGDLTAAEVRKLLADSEKALVGRERVTAADAAVRVAQRKATAAAGPGSKAPEVIG